MNNECGFVRGLAGAVRGFGGRLGGQLPRVGVVVLCLASAVGQFVAVAETRVKLQARQEWSFGEAKVHFSNQFGGARLNGCEFLGENEFKLIISPENTPINASPMYAFQVWSERRKTLTLYLSNTYSGVLRRPSVSKDGIRWKVVPRGEYQFNQAAKTACLRLRVGPRPVWVSAVEPVGVDALDRWTEEKAALPFVREAVIGKSMGGHPIRSLTLGDPGSTNYVFVLGRQHPPEVTGSIGLMAFVDTLAEDSALARRFRAQFQAVVVPMLNPDGIAEGHWRSNLGAVDLNRDWSAFSQPETAAARDAFLAVVRQAGSRPFLFVDFHSTSTNVFYCLADPKEPEPRLLDQWLNSVRRRCPAFGFQRSDHHNQGVSTARAWAGTCLGAPSVTCELGYDTEPDLIRKAGRVEAEEIMRLLLAELVKPRPAVASAGMRKEDSAQPVSVAAANSTLASIVTARFAAWDADSDGTLTARELDVLMAQPELTNQLAAAVTALKRATRPRTGSPPVLTLSNILSFATNAPATNYPALERLYREGLKRLNGCTNRSLFVSGLPRLETIHQGRLGNCFCLAPLGAMVHRDAEQVFRLFTPHLDGTCSVQLGTNTVRVPLPTDAELAMIASNEQDGIWVNLYEKAVGQVRLEARPPAQRPSSVLDAIARGGSSGTMLSVLTGHEIKRFSFKFAKDSAVNAEARGARLKELSRQLAEAAQARRLMTCGTVKTTTPGLTPNHAYAVLDYSADSDSVTLWNPHGGSFKPKGEAGLQHGYPQKDGIFRMPVADFVLQFSGMAFETAGE